MFGVLWDLMGGTGVNPKDWGGGKWYLGKNICVRKGDFFVVGGKLGKWTGRNLVPNWGEAFRGRRENFNPGGWG